MNSLPELGEYILDKPTKIGYPSSFGGMTNIMQNPKFSTVLGLLIEAGKGEQVNGHIEHNDSVNPDLIGKLSDSLKTVFREIF